VRCETADVSRRWRGQRYKARKEIYKEVYTEKGEKNKAGEQGDLEQKDTYRRWNKIKTKEKKM